MTLLEDENDEKNHKETLKYWYHATTNVLQQWSSCVWQSNIDSILVMDFLNRYSRIHGEAFFVEYILCDSPGCTPVLPFCKIMI